MMAIQASTFWLANLPIRCSGGVKSIYFILHASSVLGFLINTNLEGVGCGVLSVGTDVRPPNSHQMVTAFNHYQADLDLTLMS